MTEETHSPGHLCDTDLGSDWLECLACRGDLEVRGSAGQGRLGAHTLQIQLGKLAHGGHGAQTGAPAAP